MKAIITTLEFPRDRKALTFMLTSTEDVPEDEQNRFYEVFTNSAVVEVEVGVARISVAPAGAQPSTSS